MRRGRADELHAIAVVPKATRPTVISLFSGALGLDLGLEQAGFEVRVAVECNRFAAETIRLNRPHLPLLQRRIEEIKTSEILAKAGMKPGEATVVTGGPSCQAFSTAGQRGSVSDPRGLMFREFLRVVREARPRFFVMENVRGVLSAAIRHRPLNRRGPGFPPLSPGEELGSALKVILRELGSLGYHVLFDLVNSADFGVAQARERVLFIGSRDGEPVEIPERTHAQKPGDGFRPWLSLRDGLRGLSDREPAFSALCASKKRFLRLVPEGGNWRDLPARIQKKALGAAYVSWGGRAGFFRRLSWNKPAPALTTRPDSKATMFCHPSELRPLSVAEYARIQGFPDGWSFGGGTPQKYIQIGNAVPVRLGMLTGLTLRRAMRSRRRVETGVVLCAREELLDRLARRPRTVLNPPRMRRYKKSATARRWLAGRTREGIRRFVANPTTGTSRSAEGSELKKTGRGDGVRRPAVLRRSVRTA